MPLHVRIYPPDETAIRAMATQNCREPGQEVQHAVRVYVRKPQRKTRKAK